MFKYVFVFDLDETLVSIQQDEIFVRPYAEQILFCLWKNKNVFTVLWSAGDDSYVFNAVSALNWHHYFVDILTRKNCDISHQLFGHYKAKKYLERSLSKYITMPFKVRYIFIDDNALYNTIKDDYDETIQIPPFHGENGDIYLYMYLKKFEFFKWTSSNINYIKNAS